MSNSMKASGSDNPTNMTLTISRSVSWQKRKVLPPFAGDVSGRGFSFGAALPTFAELASQLLATPGTNPGSSGGVGQPLPLFQSTRLEFGTNLPAVWQDALATPVLSNGQLVVLWTNAVPRVFFRVRGW
jgi:hypothetical protein